MHKVLILGPSSVHFAEPGAEGTATFNLLQALLGRQAPDLEVEVGTAYLTYGERMASKAVEHIREANADIVFLQVGTTRLEDSYVVYMIRKRWPALFPRAMQFAVWLKNLSGGGTDGGPGPRGLLFRGPRALARLLIGSEDGYPLELALDQTRETIDAVARLEDTTAVVQLMPTVRKSQSRAITSRVERFGAALRAHCAARRIDFITRAEYCREIGRGPYPTVQGTYPPLEQREVDAEAMAAYIFRALEGAGAPSAVRVPSPSV